MSILDVFNGDAFTSVSLTTAVDKVPYQPSRLGELPIFTQKPITDKTAVVEERHGRLTVIQTRARGAHDNARSRRERVARSFLVPHCPQDGAIYADDILGIRQFGSETVMESVASAVNDELAAMRQDHEATFEWHRMGAIKGVLVDADGATIYDYFAEFGITPTVIGTFLTGDIRTNCTGVLRELDKALGGTGYQMPIVFCGNDFYDQFVANAEVKDAYDRWRDGEWKRDNLYRSSFPYGGLLWENYRGRLGGNEWVDVGEAHVVPMGVPNLFVHHMAPAPFVETVGTRGRPIYVKQKRMDYDEGIDLTSNSNPLMMNTRPASSIKLTLA